MASIQEAYLHNGYMYTLNRTDDYGTSWYRCDLCSVSLDGTRAIEIPASQSLITDNLSSAPGGYAGGGNPYVYVPSIYVPSFLPQVPLIPVPPGEPFQPGTPVPEPWQAWLILFVVVVTIIRRRYASRQSSPVPGNPLSKIDPETVHAR
jgi:hypothetical protein